MVFSQFDLLRKQFPHKTALFFEDRTWTYQELFDFSMSRAELFQKEGIQEGHLCIVHLSRSPEWIATVLALAFLGAVYLPIDPKLPEMRKEMIRNKSKAHFSITAGKIEKFQSGTRLDKDAFYVCYTSGSSGDPKGVIGTLSWLKKRIEWMHARYPYVENEVIALKTPINFVDHIAELFQALLSPVPMVIFKDEEVKDIQHFARLLVQYKITRLVMVPSLLKTLLQLELTIPSLQYIFSSGELLSHTLADEAKEKLPHVRLINIYGSTEVGADATYYEVSTEVESSSSTPIGFPLPGVKAWILDEEFKEVTDVAIGQIFIGGDCLAIGYLHDESATSKYFLMQKERMYATGDFGRKLKNGAIEYVGRKDSQVKIRGVRVNLIEIEQRLLQIPSIKNVCAIVYSEEIFAFYTAKFLLPDVRLSLQQFLPQYCLPSEIIYLDTFPLLPSGKIDRQTLLKFLENRGIQISLKNFENPQDYLENLCRHLLEKEEISLDSNFFDIGFNSLSINNLLLHAKQLTLIDIYTYPTIRTLATYLQEKAI